MVFLKPSAFWILIGQSNCSVGSRCVCMKLVSMADIEQPKSINAVACTLVVSVSKPNITGTLRDFLKWLLNNRGKETKGTDQMEISRWSKMVSMGTKLSRDVEGIGNPLLFCAWRDLACESTDKTKNYLATGVLDVVAVEVPPPLEEPLPLRFLIFFMSACNEQTNMRSSNSPDAAGE